VTEDGRPRSEDGGLRTRDRGQVRSQKPKGKSQDAKGLSAELGMHFTQVATVTGILAWSVTCVIHHLSIWNGVHACRLLQEAVE
jgi:hypothetical protein